MGDVATNILSNPGFEYGLNDWTVNSGNVSTTAAVKYSGANALQFTGPAFCWIASAPVACKPGDQFALDAYVMAASGTANPFHVGLGFYDGSGTPTWLWGSGTLSPVNTWTKISTGILTAPANTVGVVAVIYAEVGLATDTWYVDNVVLASALVPASAPVPAFVQVSASTGNWLTDGMTWLTGSMFGGIPNWELLIGAAAVAWLFSGKRR